MQDVKLTSEYTIRGQIIKDDSVRVYTLYSSQRTEKGEEKTKTERQRVILISTFITMRRCDERANA